MFLLTLLSIFLFKLALGIELDYNTNQESRIKRAIITKRKLNYTQPIPYYIKFANPVKHIHNSFTYLSEQTCLEFEKRQKSFKTVGIIFEISDCNEILPGMDSGKATIIQLDLQCLNNVGCVKHHIGLALGLIPHTIRWDRKDYIIIHKKNIKHEYSERYRKFNGYHVRIFNTPFDFGSITNYERDYGTDGNKVTYSAKINDLYNNMLGQREEFSFNDIKLLNDFYCSNKCPKKIKGCINGGYPDPKSCGECKCPVGYRKKLCGIPESSSGKCGPLKLFASTHYKTLEIKTEKGTVCNHLISSPIRTKVEVVVVEVSTRKRKVCTPKQALEIRHRHNKGAVGLSFCGTYKNISLRPYFSQVLVRYEGSDNQNHKAIIKYRAVR
uniref:Metalloendopeptidase n=1 Tax=Strongyloides venezuelensis TaxID=75913 RepID=A0A0K0FXC6_STRVS